MKLQTNWYNRLLKQGLQLSRDPSLALETLRLILAVRNDSIPFDHTPNESRLQLLTTCRQTQSNSAKEKHVRNTECTCLFAPN